MMRLTLAGLLALPLAGCSPPEMPAEPPVANSAAAAIAAPAPPPRPAPTFAGLWDVQSVDRTPAPEGRSVMIAADSAALVASADCVFLGELRFRRAGETLVLAAPPPGPVGSCARGLSTLEREFTRVFQAGAVARLDADRLLIEHNGRGLVATRRPPPGETVRPALLPPSRTGDAALLVGMVEIDGPCLYVRVPFKDRYTPALMMPEVRWDERTGVLHVADKQFVAGSRVSLGGSQLSGGALQWRQPPAPGCDLSRTWVTATIDPDLSARRVVFD